MRSGFLTVDSVLRRLRFCACVVTLEDRSKPTNEEAREDRRWNGHEHGNLVSMAPLSTFLPLFWRVSANPKLPGQSRCDGYNEGCPEHRDHGLPWP